MTLKSVLVILVNFWTVCYVSTNHCDVVDTLNNQWVNVNNLKTDNDPRYLSEFPASSQEECQQACCQTDKCSVAIFDSTQNQSNTNCYLLECTQQQECVFENKDGTVTFVIDKKHEVSAETKTNTKSVTVASPTLASITKQPTTTTTTAPKILTTIAKPKTTVPKTTTTAPKTTKTTTVSPTAAPVISPSTTSISSPTSKETPQPSGTTIAKTTTTTTTTTVPTTKSVATNATYSQLLKTTAAPTTISVLKTQSPTTASSTNETKQSNTTSDSVSNTTTTKSSNVTVKSSNVTTAESVINKETTQLLNTTLSSLVNSTVVQIKPPPISTQPFITVPLSLSSLSSSSSSSSSQSPSSSSTKSSITTHSPSTKDSSNNASTSATGETIISTFQTEVFSPNATNTSSDTNATQITSYGRLDNADQQEPSNAMFGGLIALFCFGTIFVLAIVVIFSKKLFEVWQRRHYSRIDYLVNGMYN